MKDYQSTRPRLYRLRPWLVRVLIPRDLVGTYTLYSGPRTPVATYTGRADTCLRRRLETHARRHRAAYFTYVIQGTPEKAFIAECGAYHALGAATTNLIHPASPGGRHLLCPFCHAVFARIRATRIRAPSADARGE